MGMDDWVARQSGVMARYPGWRWLPGMAWYVGQDPATRGRVACPADLVPDGAEPDLSDDATIGCVLRLARDAWRDPTLHAQPAPWEGRWFVMLNSDKGWSRLYGDSEGGVLMRVLREKSDG